MPLPPGDPWPAVHPRLYPPRPGPWVPAPLAPLVPVPWVPAPLGDPLIHGLKWILIHMFVYFFLGPVKY